MGLDVSKMPVKVISRGFWNKILDEEEERVERLDFKIPDPIMEIFQEYSDYFSIYKKRRSLKLKPNLGFVELTLSFTSGEYKFRVTPLEASIITYFNTEGGKVVRRSAQFLATELGVEQ